MFVKSHDWNVLHKKSVVIFGLKLSIDTIVDSVLDISIEGKKRDGNDYHSEVEDIQCHDEVRTGLFVIA